MNTKLKLLVLCIVVLVAAGVGANSVGAQANVFTAQLSGGEEVPPVETMARGQAIFRLSPDGSTLHYRLIVANIDDVLQAHIHVAPAGTNGSVVAWLYPDSPPAQLIPGTSNGVLAVGTITEANLVGPLAGMSLDALIDEMEAGNAYVNVHSVANPGGEIRGQVQ